MAFRGVSIAKRSRRRTMVCSGAGAMVCSLDARPAPARHAMSGLVHEPQASSGLVRDCADAPERRIGNDATAVREVIGSSDGCDLFTLRVLRTVAGRSFERSTGEADELLFVVDGSGRLIAADGEHQLEPEAGALLAGRSALRARQRRAGGSADRVPSRCTTRSRRGRRATRGTQRLAPGGPGRPDGHRRSRVPDRLRPRQRLRLRRRSSSATSRSAPRPPTTTSTTR